MSWTRPRDLRAQLDRLWQRGELLAALVSGEVTFPKRLHLKGPTSAEMTDRFDEVRAWIAALRGLAHCRVEMREFSHRLLGSNAVPKEVWIDTMTDAVAVIGRQREAARFMGVLAATRARLPQLLPWLAKRPLRAMELSEQWPLLLEIVAWLLAHPRPNIYLRQVDLPGIHTKFIEAHRGVLAELLDLVLPPEAIDARVSGVSHFDRRYGFLSRPERIRFRVLDPEYTLLPGALPQDITLDAASFARLDSPVSRVFITENETNFLALPPVRGAMVIFGAGYGFEMLREAAWLAHCRIHYWGDIDTHGFAILDQLRHHCAHVESFLMDRATLLAFEPLWGEEEKQTLRDLPGLTAEEGALYDELRDNRIRKNLRLEQERIGFGWVEAALASLACETKPTTL